MSAVCDRGLSRSHPLF